MAITLNTTQKAQLNSAIDRYVKGSAVENVEDAQISETVAKVAASTGFTVSDGAFLQQIRDRPVSTLLRFILYIGS